MTALAQTAKRDVAKNKENKEREQLRFKTWEDAEALLGGERLMAPFSGSRGGKDDDI